ncbi:PD40 domain-containing protein [Conexibacter sp. SYSU D00693]|uniref:TolB family protein n=1 Tax=Conexibacter sp. SYSU D00693 TaxID=2812560 RepID=UPI00196A30F4|nr:PD40 domain-containing protein [Conexibacter sp. SYSU D00693]
MPHRLTGPRPGRRPVLVAATGIVLAAGCLLPAGASSTSLPERTLRVSTAAGGGDAAGASQNPVVSVDGRFAAFESTAPGLADGDTNGDVSDIVAVDLTTKARRLVSENGDGPSLTPSISGDGRVVAFTSYATNFAGGGDTNGQPDVFVRDGRGAIVRASTAFDGGLANGPSYQPDISSDGRWVVFTSEASNIVQGDSNGKADVFARNLTTNRTLLVSTGKAASNSRSSQPAVSRDGRYVVFESAATNLVDKDSNGVSDVFIRDQVAERTERVSVATDGTQQDKAVSPPFTMAPDLSADGRYVVFESDATKLTTQDANKRTDIFLRDVRAKTTRLVSASSVNVQGNNDSFNPRISANGQFLTFQSFASNFVPPDEDGVGEDVFVRDLRGGATSVASITSTGGLPTGGPEGQFLQRPAISNDGRVAVFAATSSNLVPGDTNNAADVFVRRMDAPATKLERRPTSKRLSFTVSADDPKADLFLCKLDSQPAFYCKPTTSIRAVYGKRLTVRATGAGMLVDPEGVDIAPRKDARRPTIRVTQPRGRSLRVVRGRAADRGSGLARVEVSVVYFSLKGCQLFTGRRFETTNCLRQSFVAAKGLRRWTLRLPRSIKGPIVIKARSVDRAGNRSTTVQRAVVLA